MIFALASYGTRGDIEPCAALARELVRRGHDVRLAVPPDMIEFVETAGLTAIPYGIGVHDFLNVEFARRFWKGFWRRFWTIREPIRMLRAAWEPNDRCSVHMNAPLLSLADGADLLFTGLSFEHIAANVAEYYDIPLVTLHYFPMRVNAQLLPGLPAPVARFAGRMFDWVCWRLTKKVEDAQRSELGLPKARGPAPKRITEGGSLEVQAYDEVCFPGLASEWARQECRRPFVGTLTMALTTDSDDEVASWIAAGTPPVFFGFGSIPLASTSDTLTLISEACAELGERALVCSGWSDFDGLPRFEHVKVVGTMNYAAAFPRCRAVVHHGGTGTTAAALRAGVPALVLCTDPVQSVWGATVKRLKVGTARRLSRTTRETLVEDLTKILHPDYARRARVVATKTSKPAESIANTADLLEEFVRTRRLGLAAEGGPSQ